MSFIEMSFYFKLIGIEITDIKSKNLKQNQNNKTENIFHNLFY